MHGTSEASIRWAAARREAPTSAPGGEFWLLCAVGVVAMIVAWVWFGAAFEEEMLEQPKALSADMTMAGWGAMFGGPPLVLAHVIGMLVLVISARLRCGRVGVPVCWGRSAPELHR